MGGKIKKMKEPKKVKLELNFPGNGRVFLNYWDWDNGNDVTAELVDGNLYDENQEITLQDFIDRVKKVI